jgi:hypothetical protein
MRLLNILKKNSTDALGYIHSYQKIYRSVITEAKKGLILSSRNKKNNLANNK